MTSPTIAGFGIDCTAGDRVAGLVGAVAGNVVGIKKHAGLSVLSQSGGEASAAMAAGIADLEGLSPSQRLRSMASAALEGMFAEIEIDAEATVLFQLILPPVESTRYAVASGLDWTSLVSETAPAGMGVEYRMQTVDYGAVQALQCCLSELREGTWDMVIFGGVDSLVDRRAVLSLGERVMSEDMPDGIVPGEAGAFLALQRESDAKCSWGRLEGVSWAEEPNPLGAAEHALTGLATAGKGACTQAGIEPDGLDAVVLPIGGEVTPELEWFQCRQRLWPQRLPEKQRVAMMLGEVEAPEMPAAHEPESLRFYNVTGEVGAAQVPFSLALACGRLAQEETLKPFGIAGIGKIGVVEVSDAPVRGAVVVGAGQAQ